MDGSELYYSPDAAVRFKEFEASARRGAFYYAYNKGLLEPTGFHAFTALPASNDVLLSPLFGAWVDRILQAEQTSGLSESDARALALQRGKHLGNYAILAALWSGQAYETEAWAHEGFVMVPELGRMAAPRGIHNGLVRVTLDGSITASAPGGQTSVALDALAGESPLWQPLRRIGTSDFSVALNDIDPNRLGIYRYPVSPRLAEAEYRLWADTFTQAWDFLQEHDPHLASIVRVHLNTIIPAPTEPLTHSKTMAAGATIGAISFNENRGLRLVSQIAFGIRKDMALALRTAKPDIYPEEHMHDPVYPPSREGYGIAANLQDDSFVNIGLARFYHNLLQRGDPTLRDYYELSFARWYAESMQNLTAWRSSQYVQTGNDWLLNVLEWELYDLHRVYDSLPNAPKQAAAANSCDRYISWRLHTVIPDPQFVLYLRGLWHEQRACPAIEVPGSLNRTNEAYVNLGQRIRYVLAEVRLKEPEIFAGVQKGQYDPSLFGTVSPGDIAFAAGDYRAARQYFTHAIRQQPDNAEAWAGLAITFEHERSAAAEVLKHRPELAAAVYAAMGDRSLDPAAIAAWLTPCTVAQVCLGA